jgi:hypothetical protein
LRRWHAGGGGAQHGASIGTTVASQKTASRAHFEAQLVRFVPNALRFHYADRSFEVFDAAEIDIEQPENLRGRRLAIHQPTGTVADSPWRAVGQRLEFDAEDNILSGSVQTFVGGLDHLRFMAAAP